MTTPTELPMAITLPEPEEVQASSETVSDDSDINWAEEAGEQGDNTVDDVIEAVEGEVEVIAAPTEVVAPVTAEVQPVVPVVPAEQAVAPVVAPVTEVPATPAPVIPATPPFDMAKWEAEQLTGLEQLYAINTADAERLQTEPELIMPKLAANMHMTITKSLLTAIQAMIPDYVNQHSQQSAVEQAARGAFYTVNADLNDPKYENAILQVGKVFRAANPTAPREVAIKTIGDMVRASYGMAPVTPPAAPAHTLQSVITPPVNRPFTPARGGGQAPVKAPTMWDEFLD